MEIKIEGLIPTQMAKALAQMKKTHPSYYNSIKVRFNADNTCVINYGYEIELKLLRQFYSSLNEKLK